jgi:outer membrane protein OmpA-like peptidoglycan-associated protein
LIFIAFANKESHSQNYDESVQLASEAFKEGDFYTASLYYNNAMWFDSSDLKVAYQCAESYRLFNNYQQAKQWYKYVLNCDNKKQLPLSRFWLAMMEKSVEEYTAALNDFNIYYAENSQYVNDYYTKKSKVELDACREAPQIIANKKKVLIEHLVEGKINTPYTEFNARQLSDTALVFSAMRPISEGDFDTYIPNAYISKIYIAKSTVTSWSKTRELDAKINDKETHNANIAFSKDYNKVFFTRSKSDDNQRLQSEIYYSENISGKWQKAVKLPDNINMPGYTTTQPYLVEYDDYSILFFVSDRPGGFGKMDIYYSIFKDNKFQSPVNLGSIINTPGDDITPFYHQPTKTLYFSSDWHKGLGGYDIFYSRGELNIWTQPKNIGSPINSSSNDLYFTVNDIDNDGFFTSNRPGSLFIKSATCCNDIYSYEWQDTLTKKTIVEVVKPKDSIKKDTNITLEKKINLMLPITLYFHNDEPDPNSRAKSTTHNYESLLNDYYSLKDLYKKEYAKGLSGNFKLNAENDIEDFFEKYVAKGFSNLKLFTDLLLTDLSLGHKVNIKIKGYCSPLTTTEYNLNLAKRRISSIINYIKQYHVGVFMEYINGTAANGGRLIIAEEPLGESTASPLVSDNPKDKRNSIYSRAAAFERKIQIILYESEGSAIDNSPKSPQIMFADTVYNFGAIERGQKLTHKFVFTNKGTGDLVISGVEPSCDCTTANWPQEPVKPGNSSAIDIIVKADEDPGGYNLMATVLSNAGKGKVLLMFNVDIIPPSQEKK